VASLRFSSQKRGEPPPERRTKAQRATAFRKRGGERKREKDIITDRERPQKNVACLFSLPRKRGERGGWEGKRQKGSISPRKEREKGEESGEVFRQSLGEAPRRLEPWVSKRSGRKERGQQDFKG